MTKKYDLSIYDEDGNCIFDGANATTEAIGRGQTGRADGNLTDANIGNRRVWVKTTRVLSGDFAVLPITDASFWWRPYFTISGNTISWRFVRFPTSTAGSIPANFEFIYGVF